MRYRGSFTVEAALIMPVILGVIVFFIYIGMFTLDRCSIEYICQSVSCAAVYETGDRITMAEEMAARELNRMLILDWDTDVEIREDETTLTVRIEAATSMFPGSFTHTGRSFKHFYPKY